jgi:uncharacterized protein
MATGSLLALLDDIASVLDDVALLTKVAAKKTAGVLGDDLALNAQQVAGVQADRELPVVWAVAKGSFVNKMILVPSALVISAFAPWAITPLLMLGGAYLCFEGADNLLKRRAMKRDSSSRSTEGNLAVAAESSTTPIIEKDKIRGAIRTDFVLSTEIIVIALGTVAQATLKTQVLTLATIAILLTAGVYGFVAVIVKLDDFGLYLQNKPNRVAKTMGVALVQSAPWLMKTLAVVGTAAMFLVGGGILRHGIPGLGIWQGGMGFLADVLVGLSFGAVLVLVGSLFRGKKPSILQKQ